MTEVITKNNSRRIELFVPVKVGEKEITEVVLAPVTFGHTIRWGKQAIAGSMALLMELSGLTEEELSAIGYPDIERVMKSFLDMLPDPLRAAITEGPQAPATAAILPDEPITPGEGGFGKGLIDG